jgi:GAF domain-containing protein
VELEHRLFDLTNLLQAGRALDNLLGVQELYNVYANIVRERFGADTVALFVMDPAGDRFQLVRSFGLADLPNGFSFPRQEGLLWRAILQGKPFSTADSQGTPRFKIPFEQLHLHSLRSQAFVPLNHQGKVVGLLSIGDKQDGDPYEDDELEFLHVLAEDAAVAITTAQLYEKNERDRAELDKTVKNLSILYNIGRALIHINDLKNLLKFILGQATDTTGAQKGSLMLFDQYSGRLVVRVVKGLPDPRTEDAINSGTIICRSFAVGEGIAGQVFQTRLPIIVNATEDDERYVQNDESNVQSILCIPLIAADEAIGVINITNKIGGGGGFSNEDLELMTALGNQAAVAINNAQLYEMAITDELTKLFIRRYFNLKLEGRPGSLQKRERHLRPSDGGRGVADGGRSAAQEFARSGYGGPLRRRGIRRHPARNELRRRADHGGTCTQSGGGGAHRRLAANGYDQSGHRKLSAPREPRAGPDQSLGHRVVRGQATRPQPHLRVRRGNGK